MLSLIKRLREKFTSRECFLYSENFRLQWLNIFVIIKIEQYLNGIWLWIIYINTTSRQSKIMGKNTNTFQCESCTVAKEGYILLHHLYWWLSQLNVNLCCNSKPRWYYNDSNSFYHFFVFSISNTRKKMLPMFQSLAHQHIFH